LELFAPVEERDYVGAGGTIGRKGLDESILVGYNVVDDPIGPKNVTLTPIHEDEDDPSRCLHGMRRRVRPRGHRRRRGCVTNNKAPPARNRGTLLRSISAEFLHAARELAIRGAARDAHRSDCDTDAFECATCRMHAQRIAEAKAALRRDAFL